MILDILYAIFIQPIEWGMGWVFTQSFDFLHSYGLAIILLSLVVNIALIPIYLISDSWQAQERAIQERMRSKLDEIKLAFAGQERFMMTRMLYKINNYHPLMAARSSIGLLIQIPFFFAAYQLISNYEALNNVSFFVFNDLSKPDGLLSIGSWHFNLMPFVMTAINLASAYVYASSLSKKDKIQVYVIAGIFLVVLYSMPVALVLYWTMNNVFSLVKNIAYKKFQNRFVSLKFKLFKFGPPKLSGFLIAGALPFQFLLVSSLTFYFDNRTEIAFSIISVLPWLVILFLISTALLAFILFLIKNRRIKTVFSSLLIGLALSSWFQSQIFLWNFGPLDGRGIEWSNWSIHANLEMFFWIALFCITLLASLKRKSLFRKLPSLTYILGTASISIALINSSPDNTDKTATVSDGIFKFHPEKNVIVILLDTFQSDYFELIAEEYPDDVSFLDGFTFYRNTISSYPTTAPNLPAIFSGKNYKNEIPFKEYVDSIDNESNLFNLTSKAGLVNSFSSNVGVQPPKGNDFTHMSSHRSEKNLILTETSNLIDYGLFRVVPTHFKNFIYRDGAWFLENYLSKNYPPGKNGTDIRFVNTFNEKSYISESNLEKGTFKFLHFWTPHFPLIVNEKFEYDTTLSGQSGYTKQARGSLSLVKELLNNIKSMSLYEESEIFIISDHGTMSIPPVSSNSYSIPQRVRSSSLALLLHKPPNSEHKGLLLNDAELSLKDLRCLAVALKEHVSSDECNIVKNSLNGYKRNRVFYDYEWKHEYWGREYMPPMTEYFLNGHAYDPNAWRLGEYSYKDGERSVHKKLTLKLGSKILFVSAGNSSQLINFGWSHQESSHRWTEGNQAGLLITLDDYKSGDLLLRLTANAYLGGGLSHQNIGVSINGTQVANWQMAGLDNYDAVIPAELIPENGELNIVFDISDPSAPCEVSDSTDCRKLGFAAKELIIDYATTAITPESNPVQALGAKLSVNELIQFSNDGNANTYIAQGWSGQEASHRWTEGEQAGLLISLGDYKSGDLLLSLHGSGYLGGGLRHQNIAVSVNGAQVASWDMAGLDLYQARIPAELVPESGELNIVFDISDPKAPCDVGESTDCRKLGMSVKDLIINYVE